MRVSDLIGAHLVTESGERLGRVFDVNVRRPGGEGAEGPWQIDALVYGERGMASRFGVVLVKQWVAAGRHDEVAWERVVGIGPGEVTVRDE